ncbi:Gti1/Pac2 family-domain-containing protein [Chytriomyces cf. hyalinus JEL632]|nr:Gti1/Pac2 family-domain-containing protein [Chytriomyces cf. hyalinus JEL632]
MQHNNQLMNETFFGFVETQTDAQILVEAVIHGLVDPIFNMPIVMSGLCIRSGSVIVFPERKDQAQLSRWRDAFCWSASRMNGPFLLYREIEPSEKAVRKHKMQCSAFPSLSSSPPPPFMSGRRSRTNLFSTSSLRKNTKLVPDGFAKRTIVVTGSDGGKYRVISYFYPSDVEHIYDLKRNNNNNNNNNMPPPPPPPHWDLSSLKTPSQTPAFKKLFSKSLHATTTTPISPSVSLAHFPSAAPTRESSVDYKRKPSSQCNTDDSCVCGCVRLDLHQALHSLVVNKAWLNQPVVLAPLQRCV